MKITTFNPLVVSKKADDAIALFEELRFEKKHNPKKLREDKDAEDIRLKHPDGFALDVAGMETIPQDFTMIRMNVDSFDEAYDILVKNGFRNTRGDRTLDSASSKAATMVAPSGFMIALVEHKK